MPAWDSQILTNIFEIQGFENEKSAKTLRETRLHKVWFSVSEIITNNNRAATQTQHTAQHVAATTIITTF
jgi:hypothetical protein